MKKTLNMCVLALLLTFIFPFTSLAETTLVVTGNNVNFRSEPVIDSGNVIAKLKGGELLSLVESYDGWYLANYKGTSGFISADYVSCTGIAAITTTKVNFRSGPSTSYKSYGAISANTVVKVIDSSSEWFIVEYKNKTGYIHSKYLSFLNTSNEILLGVYSTSFSTGSSQAGRVKNIEKGSLLINEYLVKPNRTFSLLDAIGPITKEGGYYEAPEFKRTTNGTQTVIGYGGGVCQIATTLYQSVLSAKLCGSNIEITERHNHSKSVSYIEKGEDATISWDSGQDFSFKNNNKYSIRIRTYVCDGIISCMIYMET